MLDEGKGPLNYGRVLRRPLEPDASVAMMLDALPDLTSLLGRDQVRVLLQLGVAHGERGRLALLDAAAADDAARVRAEAHSLRGAVAPFGVASLAALLKRVEEGDAPVVEADAALIEFVAACRAALA